MRAKINTLHCDAEAECDEWSVDYYEESVSTVGATRITAIERAPGWLSSPEGWDLCPRHAAQIKP